MNASEKKALVDEAKKNLVKKNAVRQSFKRTPSKYALFVKKNFATAYADAKKKTSDVKQAFKLATAAVAQKYKSQ